MVCKYVYMVIQYILNEGFRTPMRHFRISALIQIAETKQTEILSITLMKTKPNISKD